MSILVPTPSLLDARIALITQIHSLPEEVQLNILVQLETDQLLNVCLIDQLTLNLCWDSYIRVLKDWSNDEFIIFKLRLLSKCNGEGCTKLKDELNDELLNDKEFILNYKLILKNSDIKYDDFLEPVNILLNTNKIKFYDKFNKQIDLIYFINLTDLTFGDDFNQSVDNLPNGIIHLTFGRDFDKPVDKLPNSITHLTFGYWFNQSVDHLPNSITHLTFGDWFNQLVDKLPDSITHLTFGSRFNQSVDNLPKSITHLIFGRIFNQLVDNIPNSITHLIFGFYFNRLVNKLFTNLRYLSIPLNYKYLTELRSILPPSVIYF